jgi:hypothetical protein
MFKPYDRVRSLTTGAVGVIMPDHKPTDARILVRWDGGFGALSYTVASNLELI